MRAQESKFTGHALKNPTAVAGNQTDATRKVVAKTLNLEKDALIAVSE